MARRTQGTSIWFAALSLTEPTKYELVKVECAKNFKPGTDSKGKIETTCLDEEDGKQYMSGGGLREYGTATFDIDADPKKASHKRLYNLEQADATVEWVVGWAGETKGLVKLVVPTIDVDTGVITLPATRSWTKFNGYVDSFPFDSDADSVVKTTVSIVRKSKVDWIPETT